METIPLSKQALGNTGFSIQLIEWQCVGRDTYTHTQKEYTAEIGATKTCSIYKLKWRSLCKCAHCQEYLQSDRALAVVIHTRVIHLDVVLYSETESFTVMWYCTVKPSYPYDVVLYSETESSTVIWYCTVKPSHPL